MTDKQTPPDWAFKRAQELRNKRGFTHLDAFAAYIAEHEQPPIDRKLLCAREAMARGYERQQWGSWLEEAKKIRAGDYDGKPFLQDYVRAIELWEEGFGK